MCDSHITFRMIFFLLLCPIRTFGIWLEHSKDVSSTKPYSISVFPFTSLRSSCRDETVSLFVWLLNLGVFIVLSSWPCDEPSFIYPGLGPAVNWNPKLRQMIKVTNKTKVPTTSLF